MIILEKISTSLMKKFLPFTGLLFCVLLMSTIRVQGQYVLNEADKEYDLYNYFKAIDLYEQAYKKKETLHSAERLAGCYGFVNNYKQAESWYAIAVKFPQSKAENLLNYAKALQSNSKFSEAKVQYQNYIKAKKDVPQDQQSVWLASCDSAITWMQHPKNVELINRKALNSVQSDWGAVPYQGGWCLPPTVQV